MNNYLDSIPQAVATIVSSCVSQIGSTKSMDDATSEWVVNLTTRLTRTLVKIMFEAENVVKKAEVAEVATLPSEEDWGKAGL